ncbi:MAG: hypothetical protein K2X82_16085 [Gemmataceae bacterium]|nr:hypothetical protein [Gemmataceae bacterium]
MKRIVLAAAVAAGTLGFAGAADAQYYYNYNTINPYNGSIINNRGYTTPFAAQGYRSYYNPYTGATGDAGLYRNAWGTNLYRSGGYNPYFGRGYQSGYYNPGFGINPRFGSYYRFRY